MKIEVSDEVGLHLRQLANERKLTIEELISAMLDRYDVVRNSATLAEFAQLAVETGMASKVQVDTSARSREILKNEFADHVDQRIRK